MNTTKRSSMRRILIILCLIFALILALCVFTKVYNKAKAAKLYEVSFSRGICLGNSINTFEFERNDSLIDERQYVEFKSILNKFYEDPSYSNFEELHRIIMANINDCKPLYYGEDTEGFLDGSFAGHTKGSMDVINKYGGMPEEMYEDYLRVFSELIEHPTPKKSDMYEEYMAKVVQKLKS